jgi:SAM-dependent methyltransferase
MSADGVVDEPRQLADLYRNRFSERELRDKKVLWDTLCTEVFQEWVPVDGTVVDLGAGNCEFTNAIKAARRIAVDLNPETGTFAEPGVEFLETSSTDIHQLEDASVQTVFTSNFFEHLPSKDLLLETLAESRRILVPGGRIVILMPNIRYVGNRYWDYLDHYLPLSHVSLVEALDLSGFTTDKVLPRFLPYTVRESRLPVRASLIKMYLRFRPAWRVLGGQMLVVAHS